MTHSDPAALIVFIIIGLPVLIGFAIAGYATFLRQKQLELMLKERELLIEKGVTDLPPLMLPSAADQKKKGNGYGNLKWGLILLFLAGALALCFVMAGGQAIMGSPHMQVTVIVAFLGLALITIHYLVRRYEREDEASTAEA